MTHACGTCAELLEMLSKVQLSLEERTDLLRRSKESLHKTTTILKARDIKIQ